VGGVAGIPAAVLVHPVALDHRRADGARRTLGHLESVPGFIEAGRERGTVARLLQFAEGGAARLLQALDHDVQLLSGVVQRVDMAGLGALEFGPVIQVGQLSPALDERGQSVPGGHDFGLLTGHGVHRVRQCLRVCVHKRPRELFLALPDLQHDLFIGHGPLAVR
jgi:hypothetical protein